MLRRFNSTSSSFAAATSSFVLLRNNMMSSHRACSTSTSNNNFVKVITNNSRFPIRPISVSNTTFSDIVGENSAHSLASPQRIAAGDLLALTDACAAQSAARHVFGRNASRNVKMEDENDDHDDEKTQKTHHSTATSVTTVAFQEIVLSVPIMSGDFLNLTGQVVNVGNSSLDVHVSVEKLEFPNVPGDRTQVHVADAYASFVAIGEDLRPVKAVPPLGHENEASVRKATRVLDLKELNRAHKKEEDASSALSYEECKQECDKIKEEIHELFKGTVHESPMMLSSSSSSIPRVSMKNGTLEAHRFFLQGFQNMHSTIFGGEILRWMENHAVYCARRFSCNFDVHTLAMHSVNFHEPILYSDAVSLRARVVNVRNTTMEVDVEVFVDRKDGRHLTSNCASFVLVNLSNFGKPRPIGIALDMSDATHEEYVAHLNAMKRYMRLARCRDYSKELKH